MRISGKIGLSGTGHSPHGIGCLDRASLAEVVKAADPARNMGGTGKATILVEEPPSDLAKEHMAIIDGWGAYLTPYVLHPNF